jgi:hypothetical protein
MSRVASRLLLLLALVLPATGCLAAAAAGAASGIYLTSRGAESVVQGSVSDVAAKSRAVMEEESIVMDAQSTEKGGDEQMLKGKKGDLDVSISIKRETPTTSKVEVTARENVAEWDKKYAEQVLTKIVQRT